MQAETNLDNYTSVIYDAVPGDPDKTISHVRVIKGTPGMA